MKKFLQKYQLHAITIIYTAVFLISVGLTFLLPRPSGSIEPEPQPQPEPEPEPGIHDFTPEKYPWVNETDV